MIIEKKGNIFTTECQTIVNTVNCVGVMGAGIAYEFRLRQRDMFEKYQQLCQSNQISIGTLWIYSLKQNKNSYEKILNFPTKTDWKYPSREQYLHEGLKKFVQTYKEKNITSIAFPLLGADKGGLDAKKSLEIMHSYLNGCDIDVEIWHFDPEAKDELYQHFKSIFCEIDIQTIKQQSSIRIDKLNLVKKSLDNPQINSLSGLLRVKGIGDTTVEKLFDYVNSYEQKNQNLFTFYESEDV